MLAEDAGRVGDRLWAPGAVSGAVLALLEIRPMKMKVKGPKPESREWAALIEWPESKFGFPYLEAVTGFSFAVAESICREQRRRGAVLAIVEKNATALKRQQAHRTWRSS